MQRHFEIRSQFKIRLEAFDWFIETPPSVFMNKYSLLLAAGMTVSVVADEWPQYRGPHHTGASTETMAPWGTGGLKAAWKTPAPNGFSSFAVAGGFAATLYAVQGKETVAVLEAGSGRTVWLSLIHI